MLEPAGFAISRVVNGQECSSVAFDGTNYLVAWEDDRSGSGCYISRLQVAWRIDAARVSEAGVPLDEGGIPITTGADIRTSPNIAFDDLNRLVLRHI